MPDITLKIKLDGKDVEATATILKEDLKGLRNESKSVGDTMSQWGMIVTGFKESLDMARQVISQVKDDVLAGTMEVVIKNNFKGTAEDLELFRTATAKTVDDGDLIKLSNYGESLSLSMTDQAMAFDIAKDAVDKFGASSVQEGFDRFVLGSEGSVKAIKGLGIETKVFQKIVEELAAEQGKAMNDLDPEIQKRIRIDAMYKALGETLEKVTSRVQNDNDKLKEMGLILEESHKKMGVFIADALVPLIDTMKGAGPVAETLIGYTVQTGTVTMALIPILIQYKTMKVLQTTATIANTAAVEGETVAIGINSAAMLGIIGVLGGLVIYHLAVQKAIEETNRKMHDETLKSWVSEMTVEINKLDEATARWTKTDNDRKKSENDASIKKLKEDLPKKDQPIVLDALTHKAVKNESNPGDAIREQIKALEMLNEKYDQGNKLIDERIQKLNDDKNKNIPTGDAEEKTYEQKLAEYLKYYEDIAAIDDKYVPQYKEYLNEQWDYYNIVLLKKRGSLDNFSNEELEALQNVRTRMMKINESMSDGKAKIDETISKSPDASMSTKDLTKDIQNDFPDLINRLEKSKETEKAIKDLRIEAMQEGFAKDSAIIDSWYAENKETALYKTSVDAKLSIDQTYSNKKLALQRKEKDNTIGLTMQTLQAASGLFAQHTAAAKAISIAMAYINTYEAASKALTAGPIIGPILAAITIAVGIAQVANIVGTTIPGYERGGIVVGEKGPEIIAPMQDYASGQALLVSKTIIALQNEMKMLQFQTAANPEISFEKYAHLITAKLDDVTKAFQEKQFGIDLFELRTAQKKIDVIYKSFAVV